MDKNGIKTSTRDNLNIFELSSSSEHYISLRMNQDEVGMCQINTSISN